MISSVIGSIIVGRQNEQQFIRQMKIDDKKQQLALENAQRAKLVDLIEMRCTHLEGVLVILTQDMKHVFDTAMWVIETDDQKPIETRIAAYREQKDKYDQSEFVKGPIIRAFDDEELSKAWDQLNHILGELIRWTNRIYQEKFDDKRTPDLTAWVIAAHKYRESFLDAAGLCYRHLDRIRKASY